MSRFASAACAAGTSAYSTRPSEATSRLSGASNRCVRGGSGGPDAVIRGLYVTDTSLFPTGLGVNPMLTTMALARRVSRTVLAET